MRQAIIFLLLSVFLVSCIDEFSKDLDKIGEPEWNPTVGLPFLSGTFTMEDYVDATSDDIKITQSAEGVVIIEYNGQDITSDYAEDLIEVPTQSFEKQIDFTNSQITDFPISGSLSTTRNFDSDITPEQGSTDVIDSVYLKAGTLTIQIETNVPADGTLDLTINSLLLNGEKINTTTGWTYDAGNPGVQTFNENIDLSGVFGDFTKEGTTFNNFNFDAAANLTFTGEPLSPTDYIKINIVISNPQFRLVYGKFSERTFDTELETVGLGIFDSVAIEGFYLDKPRVEFNFSSSYGVPVEANIVTLNAINSANEVLPFSGSAITNPTEVLGPGLEEVGSSVETTLVIDKSNSNITEVISFLPSELDYQFSGKVLSPSPTASQFVLDTSRVIGDYKVILPLDGRVARFESEQTVDMEGLDLEVVEEMTFTIKTRNGLPIKVGLEITFVDEQENELLTLFKDETTLEPGVIDGNGFVISPTENTISQTVSADRIAALANARQAILKTILNTGKTGGEVVKFRMTDEVAISLFAQAKLDF
jgi:hypothetical protein